jgi:hypothetical protein
MDKSETITFFGRLEQMSKSHWFLEETACNALEAYAKNNYEVKTAIPVNKWGKTVGVYYTLQRKKQ